MYLLQHRAQTPFLHKVFDNLFVPLPFHCQELGKGGVGGEGGCGGAGGGMGGGRGRYVCVCHCVCVKGRGARQGYVCVCVKGGWVVCCIAVNGNFISGNSCLFHRES